MRPATAGGGGWQVDYTDEGSIATAQVPTAPAATWDALVAAFQTIGIEATTSDRAGLRMGNQEFRSSRIDGRYLSAYLDCGSGAGGLNADRYQVTMAFMVQLGSEGTGTTVTTFLDALAEPRDVSGTVVPCRSRGALEARLFELLGVASPN
jgi:hypothetical protein